MPQHADEVRAIEARYARRGLEAQHSLYDPMDRYVCLARQERERAIIRCLRRASLGPIGELRVLEVGCGRGDNLIELIRLGFSPKNLVGNELQSERLAQAGSRLPQDVRLIPGDACEIDLAIGPFDVALQSTVFTSILDNAFQERLARKFWTLVRPGGGVLWYDFVCDNPRNADVRGVPVRRIRQLFPEASIRVQPITLAPPIGRRLCRLSPALYPLVNALPVLRTHVLAWIAKPQLP